MKNSLKHVTFSSLEFQPRHTNGDIAQGVEIIGSKDGTKLGFGFGKMTSGTLDEWTVKYDEVITCLEGAISIHAHGQTCNLGPKDSVFIPKGTSVVYQPISESLLVYAILPADWNETDA